VSSLQSFLGLKTHPPVWRPEEGLQTETHVRPFFCAKMFSLTGYASKLLLTVTNLVAFYPIRRAEYRSDRVILLYACLSSLLHHSVEVRYYEPALGEWAERAAWWFLKNDQFGAVLAILSLGSWKLLAKEWKGVSVALFCMIASEVVMYVPFFRGTTKVFWRTLLHVVWHCLSLGYVASRAVSSTYAKEERFYEWFVRKMLGIVD